jgi:hypothetical protein
VSSRLTVRQVAADWFFLLLHDDGKQCCLSRRLDIAGSAKQLGKLL